MAWASATGIFERRHVSVVVYSDDNRVALLCQVHPFEPRVLVRLLQRCLSLALSRM
jgi:hypothetical protein